MATSQKFVDLKTYAKIEEISIRGARKRCERGTVESYKEDGVWKIPVDVLKVPYTKLKEIKKKLPEGTPEEIGEKFLEEKS